MSEQDAGRCGTCGAFTRVVEDPKLGRVGECALEVFAPPLRATSTCSRYRPKGGQAPAPRPRAAGEPRRGGAPRTGSSTTTRPSNLVSTAAPLPSEIDIDMDIQEFRSVLRQVLGEELGISQPELGPRWQGGEIILNPGREGTQEKRIPIDVFFSKVVMVRDKLRVLEAKLNGHPNLSAEDKVQLQGYITGCYGSLTTFNVLFAEKSDQFSGQRSQ